MLTFDGLTSPIDHAAGYFGGGTNSLNQGTDLGRPMMIRREVIGRTEYLDEHLLPVYVE
jgi:hypothetical protein